MCISVQEILRRTRLESGYKKAPTKEAMKMLLSFFTVSLSSDG